MLSYKHLVISLRGKKGMNKETNEGTKELREERRKKLRKEGGCCFYFCMLSTENSGESVKKRHFTLLHKNEKNKEGAILCDDIIRNQSSVTKPLYYDGMLNHVNNRIYC